MIVLFACLCFLGPMLVLLCSISELVKHDCLMFKLIAGALCLSGRAGDGGALIMLSMGLSVSGRDRASSQAASSHNMRCILEKGSFLGLAVMAPTAWCA